MPIGGVIGVLLAIPSLYLVGIGVRTLLRQKQISIFGMMQAGIAMMVGFGGAVRVIAHQGMNPIAIGLLSLLLGAGCHVVAFTSIDRRLGRGRSLYTYTTFAGLLILVGSTRVFDGPAGAGRSRSFSGGSTRCWSPAASSSGGRTSISTSRPRSSWRWQPMAALRSWRRG